MPQGGAITLLVLKRHRLSRARTLRLLEELENAPGTATTLYVPPGSAAPDIENTPGMAPWSNEIQEQVCAEIARSRTGAGLFWGGLEKCLVLPPFPVRERLLSSGYEVEPLRSLLKRDPVLAVVLVRLGAYAVGVFRGEELVASKVGTGLVHSRHKKGGSSQRRFERRRGKQAESFFDRACARVRERLEPHVGQLDHLFYGGERHTLAAFRKRCPFLLDLDHLTSEARLNVREPGQATLEAAINEVWTSDVVRWHESGDVRPRFSGDPESDGERDPGRGDTQPR
jgi:hypothetical protein